MSRSGYLSIAVTILICGVVLLIQYFQTNTLSEGLKNEREAITLLESEVSVLSPRDMSADKAQDTRTGSEDEALESIASSPEVTEAREIIKRLVADMESPSSSPLQLFKMLPDILRVVQDLNIDQLLEVAEGLDDSSSPRNQSGEGAVRMILHLLVADQDPSLILDNEDLMNDPEMRRGALASLARQNPAAANRWMESSDMPTAEKDHFRTMMLFQTMRSDVNAGVKLLRQLKEENHSNTRMGMPLPLEKIDELKSAMENSANDDMRGELMNMILTSAMIHTGIAGARETVEELDVSQEEMSEVVSEVINQSDTMRMDPKGTLEWLEDVQSPEEFRQSLPNAIRRWAATDYNAAGEWLGSLEPSPTKDAAIQSFSSSIAQTDPEAAAIWSMQIQDEEQRHSALQVTIATWQQRDAEAANDWIEAEGLDPEDFAASSPDQPTELPTPTE